MTGTPPAPEPLINKAEVVRDAVKALHDAGKGTGKRVVMQHILDTQGKTVADSLAKMISTYITTAKKKLGIGGGDDSEEDMMGAVRRSVGGRGAAASGGVYEGIGGDLAELRTLVEQFGAAALMELVTKLPPLVEKFGDDFPGMVDMVGEWSGKK